MENVSLKSQRYHQRCREICEWQNTFFVSGGSGISREGREYFLPQSPKYEMAFAGVNLNPVVASICYHKHMSQDLTFLYPVRSLSRSTRPIRWTPRLRSACRPRLLVLHTTLAGGHIFMTVHGCTVAPPKPPVKVAVLAKSISQPDNLLHL